MGLNKKILCFVDECGTIGAGEFYLGAVLVYARDAGRLDKCFSDLLEPTASEIHAVHLDDAYLQSLMLRFAGACERVPAVFLNRKHGAGIGSAPVLCAQAFVETVKIGMKRFRSDILKQPRIGNVEVITDINQHNEHRDFDAEIERARGEDGVFRGVVRVTRIDSAASRLLQLADAVAYSRKWIAGDKLNAAGLRKRYRILVL